MYGMRTKAWYESEGFQICVSAVLFLCIIAGIIWYTRAMNQQKADAINAATGSNLTADDVRVMGDSIRVYIPTK